MYFCSDHLGIYCSSFIYYEAHKIEDWGDYKVFLTLIALGSLKHLFGEADDDYLDVV